MSENLEFSFLPRQNGNFRPKLTPNPSKRNPNTPKQVPAMHDLLAFCIFCSVCFVRAVGSQPPSNLCNNLEIQHKFVCSPAPLERFLSPSACALTHKRSRRAVKLTEIARQDHQSSCSFFFLKEDLATLLLQCTIPRSVGGRWGDRAETLT